MNQSHLSETDVARYWDANADLWAEQVRRGWDVYREYLNTPALLRLIGDIAGMDVLDAGCGEGYNTRLLARLGARITGVDLSERMIAHAREAEAREPLGIRYDVASFTDLSRFAAASFDMAVSFMALMDGPDFDRAMAEIHRVLRPGGALVFSISHPCFMTPGYGWVGGTDSQPLQLTASDYFNDQSHVLRWRFSKGPIPEDTPPFAVPVFPRTLSHYVNGLLQAGFVLQAMQEPRPSQAMCDQHPWLQRWRDHAAIFLHVRAVKP